MVLTNLISLSPPLTHALVCLLTISLSTLSQALVDDWDRSLCLSLDPNPISVLQQDLSLSAPPCFMEVAHPTLCVPSMPSVYSVLECIPSL